MSWKRNFWILWAAEVVAIVGFQVIQPFLPYYVQELGVEGLDQAVVWAGRIGTAAGLAMAISSPIWGGLADRLGRKPMVVRAMLGGGVTVILMAYVTTVEELLVARLLQGALAGTVTACITMVSTTTPRIYLGFALGMMQAAFRFGAAAGPLVGGPLIARFGYRPCFVVSGVLVLLAGVVVQAFVREHFVRAPAEEGTTRLGFLIEGLHLLRNGPFRLVLVAMTLIQFAFGFIMPVIPLFLQSLAHTDDIESLAGPIFGAWMLVGGISSVAMGRWSERFGVRRTLQGGLAVAGLFYLAQSAAPDVSVLATLLILSGVASGAIQPVANVLITRIVPEGDRGKAFGVVSSASALGWAIGPVLGGHLAASTGFATVFVVTGVMFLALAIWVGLSLGSIDETPGEERELRVRALLRQAFSRRRRGP
ncbi:MAG: MFS transporter [Gemmatimonadota bacterium]